MLAEYVKRHEAQHAQIIKQGADLVASGALVAELCAGRDEQGKILDEYVTRLAEMKACIAMHDEELNQLATLIQKVKGMGGRC